MPATTIDPTGWYSLREAAEVLPLSTHMLRARCRAGRIAHRRVEPLTPGGRPTYRIRGDEVLRLLGGAVIAEQPRESVEPFDLREAAALARLGLASPR